jgi:hypothetical protein
MRSNSALALLLLVVAAACLLIGILYALGALQIAASGGGPHYKHFILFLVLAVVFLVAANFARRRAA